jgi:hypothetical protein
MLFCLSFRGMMWMCYITTDANFGDVTPTSPTSSVSFSESPYYNITWNPAKLIGIGAAVHISYGTSTAMDSMMSKLSITRPFSLAFGGGGGSYGGAGGPGYGLNPVGPTYNDEELTDLLGGSGGCMRGISPFEINAIMGPPAGELCFLTGFVGCHGNLYAIHFFAGRGGHGGGAIEIVASNDIVIGTMGIISMRGLPAAIDRNSDV